MDNIDVNVPMYMNLWLFHVAFVVATIVLISYSTPIFLVLFVPLTIIFLVVQVSHHPILHLTATSLMGDAQLCAHKSPTDEFFKANLH